MQQLLKVTSEPLQFVRFSQNAHFVSSDSLDLERRKALARHFAFQQRCSAQTGKHSVPDIDYIKEINLTFAKDPGALPLSAASTPPDIKKQSHIIAKRQSPPHVIYSQVSDDSGDVSRFAQAQSSYIAERGSFEIRVAKGDLTFVPSLQMTVITQYPEVNFEYVGGFNYVPPSAEESFGTINLSI